MGFLKRYASRINVVEYTCSPVLEGWLVIGIGTVFALIFIVAGIIKGPSDPVFIWMPALFLGGGFAFGIYYVKFRRKPLKREVTLGGWYHRLWLRSKWRFITTGLAISLVSATIGWAVCELIFEGYSAFAKDFADWLRGWFIWLIVCTFGVMRQYIAFYQYYRSPEYRRSLTKNNDNATHV